MDLTCEKCGTTNKVKMYSGGESGFYDEDKDEFVSDSNPKYTPETLDDGNYCDNCVDNAQNDWSKEEEKSYRYDNDGNRGDEPGYSED